MGILTANMQKQISQKKPSSSGRLWGPFFGLLLGSCIIFGTRLFRVASLWGAGVYILENTPSAGGGGNR
jgi:hypothetical protein